MHTTWTKRQLANCIVQSLHQTKHRNPTSQSCHPAPTAPKPNKKIKYKPRMFSIWSRVSKLWQHGGTCKIFTHHETPDFIFTIYSMRIKILITYLTKFCLTDRFQNIHFWRIYGCLKFHVFGFREFDWLSGERTIRTQGVLSGIWLADGVVEIIVDKSRSLIGCLFLTDRSSPGWNIWLKRQWWKKRWRRNLVRGEWGNECNQWSIYYNKI